MQRPRAGPTDRTIGMRFVARSIARPSLGGRRPSGGNRIGVTPLRLHLNAALARPRLGGSWLVVLRWPVEGRRGDEISDHSDDCLACEAGAFGLADQFGEARA